MHFDIHLGLAGISGTSSQAKANFNFNKKQEEHLRRCTFVLLTILPPVHQTGFCSPWIVPNRSRANHAVRYVCPEWTWPADELINIREMSERTSVPASTLRYYEKLGLITSERETSGSQRRYSKATFYRIILITLAQSAGFNLDEIAEQLADPTGYPSVTAEGLGTAAQAMGAAHRSARRRA